MALARARGGDLTGSRRIVQQHITDDEDRRRTEAFIALFEGDQEPLNKLMNTQPGGEAKVNMLFFAYRALMGRE